MKRIVWERVFDEVIERQPGASKREIAAFVATVGSPLSADEFSYCAETSERWKVPNDPLPQSYLSLLRWSNGGEFRNGDRLLQFFPAMDPNHGVRTMMLAYGVPFYSPGLFPFAFNGGGVFYAFDMRFQAVRDEYSIVGADSGCHHVPVPLAESFLDACQGRQSIEQIGGW